MNEQVGEFVPANLLHFLLFINSVNPISHKCEHEQCCSIEMKTTPTNHCPNERTVNDVNMNLISTSLAENTNTRSEQHLYHTHSTTKRTVFQVNLLLFIDALFRHIYFAGVFFLRVCDLWMALRSNLSISHSTHGASELMMTTSTTMVTSIFSSCFFRSSASARVEQYNILNLI